MIRAVYHSLAMLSRSHVADAPRVIRYRRLDAGEEVVEETARGGKGRDKVEESWYTTNKIIPRGSSGCLSRD